MTVTESLIDATDEARQAEVRFDPAKEMTGSPGGLSVS